MTGLSHGVEDAEDFGLEQVLELGAVGDAVAEGAIAEAGDDFVGGGGADVGGEEGELEVVEGGFVDFAGEGDDGGDGVGERLAGAGDRLLHAVEEAAGLRRAPAVLGRGSGVSRLPKSEKAIAF